jgi:spore coat polysaccharide biosynthesis predicted glycosyltransferase SpsG
MLKINIFCKASLKEGLGHLIRQIHIAKELRAQNADIFFYIPNFKTAIDIIEQHHFPYLIVEDFNTSLIKKRDNTDATLLDIQDTKLSFIHEIRKQSPKIISFEDQGEGRNLVDLLIDSNLNSDDSKNIPQKVKTLFGLSYSVLGPNFEIQHTKKRDFSDNIESLLLTFGGTDPHNITLDLAKQVPNNIKTTIILGAGFKNEDGLQNFDSIQIKKNVQDMASMLVNHDAVFCSGGVTLHEAMCLGTPAFVISQALHQENKAKIAEKAGAAINLGRAKSWDENRLTEIFKLGRQNLQDMSMAGKKCIDGTGLKKVVEAILSTC